MKKYIYSKFFVLALVATHFVSCDNSDDGITTPPETNPTILPSPIAHYPFDNNAEDAVGNSDGVVLEASASVDRNSNVDAALLFDGSDDQVEIPVSDVFNFGNSFSISVWVKPEQKKTQTIVRRGAHVNGQYKIPYGLSLSQEGDIVFSVTMDETTVNLRKPGYNLNEWLFLTGVFDDGLMSLYVDGEFYSSIQGTGSVLHDFDLPVIVGSRLRLPADTFAGSIDDLKIFDVALTPPEVQALKEIQ